jgi:hypothetical protein
VNAYKFLRPNAIGPFSGFRWPTPRGSAPGPWVDADGAPIRCRRGVHACRLQDLPWWLADELWEVELAGDVVAYPHKVAGRRGRLVRRIDGWTGAARRDYVHACAWRARDRALEALDAPAAERLRATATLEEVQSTARELAEADSHARIALAMAADGATTALSELPAMGAYVAAHAARRAGGEAAMAAERRWQAAWLAERLALNAAAG